jgi:hypothetical protein
MQRMQTAHVAELSAAAALALRAFAELSLRASAGSIVFTVRYHLLESLRLAQSGHMAEMTGPCPEGGPRLPGGAGRRALGAQGSALGPTSGTGGRMSTMTGSECQEALEATAAPAARQSSSSSADMCSLCTSLACAAACCICLVHCGVKTAAVFSCLYTTWDGCIQPPWHWSYKARCWYPFLSYALARLLQQSQQQHKLQWLFASCACPFALWLTSRCRCWFPCCSDRYGSPRRHRSPDYGRGYDGPYDDYYHQPPPPPK